MRGSTVVDYPWLKFVLNRLANWFIKILFGFSLNDTTNAFKCYRRTAIDGARPFLSPHFNLTVELPLKAIARGYSYATIPISWRNRSHGVAKLKIEEMGSRYLFIVLNIWLERMLTKGDYHRAGLSPAPAAVTAAGEPWWSFSGVVIALAIIAMLPFFLLAPFNRPIVDDFLFAKQLEVSGYWPAQWMYYTTTYGRYTALAIISLNPMTFGPKYIWFLSVTPFIVISLTCLAAWHLARSVPELRSRRKEAAAVAGAGLVAYTAMMPSVWQGFYWWSAQCCFELGNAFTAFTVGTFLRLPWAAEEFPRRRLAWAGLVTFVATGTNEITAVNIFGAFVLVSMINRWRRPLPRRYWTMAAIVFLSVAAAVLAPGNLKKFGYSAGLPFAVALAGAFAASGKWLWMWLTGSAMPLLSLAVVVVIASAAKKRGVRTVPAWVPVAGLFVVWAVVFLDLLFLYKGVGAPPHPSRSMNTVLFAVLIAWFAVLYTIARSMGDFLARLGRPTFAILIAVATVAAFFWRPHNMTDWRRNNVLVAYGDVLTGRARTYAHEADVRFRLFASRPWDIVETSRYSVYPVTIAEQVLELTDDVDNALNRCVQNYFNNRGVRVTDDRRITTVERVAVANMPTGRVAFIYVPPSGDSPQFQQVMLMASDHYWVGDSIELRHRLDRLAANRAYILWEERYAQDPQAKIWLSLAERRVVTDGVTFVELSEAGFRNGIGAMRDQRRRELDQHIDARVAAAQTDPLLAWVLHDEYEQLQDEYPSIYQKVRELPRALPATAPLHPIADGLAIYDYRLESRGGGRFALYIFFKATGPLREDARVLVHVLPAADEIGELPAARQPLHFDDWSFDPEPPTSKWAPGTVAIHSVVTTNLHHATLRIGLHSARRGTIGAVDFPERVIQ
jgi:hypothetical protein